MLTSNVLPSHLGVERTLEISNPVSCKFEPGLMHQKTDIGNRRTETPARKRPDTGEKPGSRVSEPIREVLESGESDVIHCWALDSLESARCGSPNTALPRTAMAFVTRAI